MFFYFNQVITQIYTFTYKIIHIHVITIHTRLIKFRIIKSYISMSLRSLGFVKNEATYDF